MFHKTTYLLTYYLHTYLLKSISVSTTAFN